MIHLRIFNGFRGQRNKGGKSANFGRHSPRVSCPSKISLIITILFLQLFQNNKKVLPLKKKIISFDIDTTQPVKIVDFSEFFLTKLILTKKLANLNSLNLINIFAKLIIPAKILRLEFKRKTLDVSVFISGMDAGLI